MILLKTKSWERGLNLISFDDVKTWITLDQLTVDMELELMDISKTKGIV